MLKMFKRVLVAGLVLLPGLTGRTVFASSENPFLPKLPFKSARITYSATVGESVKVEETLYIKGNLQASVITTKTDMMGQKETTRQLVITLPDKIIDIDLKTNSAQEIPNPYYIMYQKFKKLSEHEKEAFLENMEKNKDRLLFGYGPGMKIRRIGKENIMGRACDVYEIMGEKIWIWTEAQIPLKHSGQMEKIATKIEENIEIKDSRFEVPAQVQVSVHPANATMKKMAEQMFVSIKEGKTVKASMPSSHKSYSAPDNAQPVAPDRRDKKLTPEEENRIREQYREQGMQPEMIEQMMKMMQGGMH